MSAKVGGGGKLSVGARENVGVVGVRREVCRWRWRRRTKSEERRVSRM